MSAINDLPISRRGLLAGFAGLGLAAAGIAGCSGGTSTTQAGSTASSSSSGSSYDPVTLKVAFMPNLGSASSLFAGIEQGYFEKMGITIETQQFQGGPAEITAMQSGEIDIAQIGHGAHALCIKGQAKVFAFDQLSMADSVVTDKSKVPNAAALKGKKVGVASGTSSEIILNLLLRDAGLSDSDIEKVEMDVSGMTTALISGQIDAAATWSPNTVTIEEKLGDNYLVLANNTDYEDEVAFPSSFVCLPEYAEKNAEILERFAAAIDMAQAYRAEHIDDIAKLLAKKLDLPEETLLQSTGEGDWEGSAKTIGDMDTIKGYYEAQQKVFIDNGKIDAAVPVDDYVLFDAMEKGAELYKENK
ncbi:ABC transporter substrate-binding protein [Collinsella vaginalis]|uniref:ABC transporter substrate-binding protein n=1 Tax=Collinsella vaginalis TaxID=1870987 RepID=UPI000A2701ED|nr:ABC transporter substrate-binding protein [Collinsella vaginalis]